MGGFNFALPQAPTYNASGVTPEPVEGNSLTQYIRSLANYLSATGQKTFQQGQGNVQAGIQGTADAVSTVNPAVKYWTSLLSGDHAKIAEALAPEIQQIQQSDQAALQRTAEMGGRGGGRTGMLAQQPFQTAGKVSNLVSQVQPTAAAALPALANTQLGAAGQIGQLGAAQAQAGGNFLQLGANTQLGVRGQDTQADNANKSIFSSLAAPFTQLGADATGLGVKKLFPSLFPS